MGTINPQYCPDIAPVPTGTPRPLWSVMIPTYNCADFLRLTLKSVLIQDPGPELMQIEVVDDVSTRDDPEAVVKEMGQGRIKFFRQKNNVGATANFNTCVRRSKGRFIHILHGDDLVKEGFYKRIGAPLLENPEIGAAFCRQVFIDEHGKTLETIDLEQPDSGILPDFLPRISMTNCVQPPSIVIRRSVYENLGGYDLRLFHTADWEMWVRITSNFPIWYETEAMALYRRHTTSDSAQLFLTGRNMQDRRRCIQIFGNHLPPNLKEEYCRAGLENSALYAIETFYNIWRTGYRRQAFTQLKESLITSRSPRVWVEAIHKGYYKIIQKT
ncbi:glycosyltransferase family 2 protein [Chloroflexota bacterium]